MSQLPLKLGAYSARSIIAEAQRCVNLYTEPNPEDAEAPTTHYPTPGLTVLASGGGMGGRGAYTASNGVLYIVKGTGVYRVTQGWDLVQLGTIPERNTPVGMVDDDTQVWLVDGTPVGYTIDLVTDNFQPIADPTYDGADTAQFLDGYVIFNRPNSQQFYCTNLNSTAFDPLFFASKTGAQDLLASLIVVHREIWLVGTSISTEVWYDAGASLFPFQIFPGVFQQHGTPAKYSLATHDMSVFFLAQSEQGKAYVVEGVNYKLSRISTFAIENELRTYNTLSDAIGFCYKQAGHVFYVLTFPSANKTWVFDKTAGQWHERVYIDNDGQENRWRGMCYALAYGTDVTLDWQTGDLLKIDLDNYTDAGQPIVRRRGFPHLVNDGKRVHYASFIADMECGEYNPFVGPLALASSSLYCSTSALASSAPFSNADPFVSLRWSDDRGRTWGNPVQQTIGAQGEYLTQPQWNRLGMARDRVFELFWSVPVKTALNGAFVESQPFGQ